MEKITKEQLQALFDVKKDIEWYVEASLIRYYNGICRPLRIRLMLPETILLSDIYPSMMQEIDKKLKNRKDNFVWDKTNHKSRINFLAKWIKIYKAI
jgi:hypothetical protein